MDDVVWTTDKQCLMPSLSSLSILSTDIRTANHMYVSVQPQFGSPMSHIYLYIIVAASFLWTRFFSYLGSEKVIEKICLLFSSTRHYIEP